MGETGFFCYSLRTAIEEFAELCEREEFQPAPYLARYKWVMMRDIALLSEPEWRRFLEQSHRLAAERLPGKVKKELGLWNR